MKFQIPNKPVYQPPTPNIKIQPVTQNLAGNIIGGGGIFAVFYPSGPCASCG